jgi:hypothetical protein
MERRLAGWKRMYLSKGGWLTLLKLFPTFLRINFFISNKLVLLKA